jgi:hypothetical protein
MADSYWHGAVTFSDPTATPAIPFERTQVLGALSSSNPSDRFADQVLALWGDSAASMDSEEDDSPTRTEPASWNRYAYVGDDPVNKLDPTAQKACDTFKKVGGFAMGLATIGAKYGGEFTPHGAVLIVGTFLVGASLYWAGAYMCGSY